MSSVVGSVVIAAEAYNALRICTGLIVCLIVMSKIFSKQRTNDCDTLYPFCSRTSLHLRCVSDKFISLISYTGAQLV